VDRYERHVLGDWINSQGGRFENYRRAQLLLELEGADTMRMFAGEDAQIERADGRVEHWQMKRAAAPQDSRLFTSFYERAAAAPAAQQRVLVTDVELRGRAAELFAEHARQCECDLRHETWPFDRVLASARVRATLIQRLDEAIPDADFRSILHVSQIERYLGKLARLHDRLESGKAVTGHEVRAKTWGELAQRLVPLYSFATWESLGEAGAAAATEELLRARDAFAAGARFTTDVAEATLNALATWLADPPSQASLVLLTGPSGCGKTWALAEAATAASKRVPVYCSDVSPGESTALEKLSRWAGGPCVIVLDEFIERDWQPIVTAARTSTNPLLIIAAADSATGRELNSLRRYYTGSHLYEVRGEHLLTAREREQLREQRGAITLGEREFFAQANVRRALRWVNQQPDEQPAEKSDALAAAAASSDAALIFVFAAALGVRSPLSVLTGVAAGPSETEPIVQKALQRQELGERILWVEDREVARRAVEILAGEPQVIKSRLHVLVAATLDRIATAPENANHRTFVRKLLLNSTDSELLDVGTLLVDRQTSVAAIIEAEDQPSRAYGWLQLLVEAAPELSLVIGTESLRSNALPRTAADIVILATLEGREQAASVLQAVASKGPIDPIAAAAALEMCRKVDGPGANTIARAILEIISSSPVSFADLLNAQNTAQLLPRLVIDRGSSHHREWLAGHIFRALKDDGSQRFAKPWMLIPPALEAFSRVLMQRRVWMVKPVPAHVRDARAGIGPSLAGRLAELRAALDEQVAMEESRFQEEMPFATAMAHVDELLDEPNLAVNPIVALLDFAQSWGEAPQVQQISDVAWSLLARRVEEQLPIDHVQVIVFELSDAYWLARAGIAAQGLLLRAVCDTHGSSLRSLFAVAGQDLRGGPRADEAAWAIIDYARSGPAADRVRDYLASLSHAWDLEHSVVERLVADYKNVDQAKYGASSCLNYAHLAARQLDLDPDELAGEVWTRWRSTPPLRAKVLAYCIRQRSLATAAEVAATESPYAVELSYEHAALAALAGEVDRARHAVSAANVQPAGHGARPGTISRAFHALASVTDGAESELWKIAADLTWPHRLAIASHS
jgi:hypothetical protein